jgi:hypothetical protein
MPLDNDSGAMQASGWLELAKGFIVALLDTSWCASRIVCMANSYIVVRISPKEILSLNQIILKYLATSAPKECQTARHAKSEEASTTSREYRLAR